MVKKRDKTADAPAPVGWGATTPNTASEVHAGISTGESREPPAEGEEPDVPHPFPVTGEQQSVAEDAEWQGADPAAPPPVEPEKPKKGKGKAKAETPPADPIPATPKAKGGNVDPLVQFAERIERLAEEKAAITEDMKEVFGEAKASGYDVGVFRKVLARRRMDPSARAEMDALVDLYEQVLGV